MKLIFRYSFMRLFPFVAVLFAGGSTFALHEVDNFIIPSHEAYGANETEFGYPLISGRTYEFIAEFSSDSGAEVVEAHLYGDYHGTLTGNREGSLPTHSPVAIFSKDEISGIWKATVESIKPGLVLFGVRSRDNHGDENWSEFAYNVLPSTTKINFAPSGLPMVEPEWMVDNGDRFGQRSPTQNTLRYAGHYYYGWSDDISDAGLSASFNGNDSLNDTGIATGDQNGYLWAWDLAVPDGVYEVKLRVGNPAKLGAHRFSIEDTVVVTATTDSATPQLLIEEEIQVRDGRLTIRELGGDVPAVLVSLECKYLAELENVGEAYIRGTTDYRSGGFASNFHAFVRPLSYQKGLKLVSEATSDSVVRQFDWYRYDQENAAHEDSYIINADRPIVTFGERAGGSMLFTEKEYAFAIGAGRIRNNVPIPSGGNTGGVFIDVIDAATGQILESERINIEIPDPNNPKMVSCVSPSHGLTQNELVCVENVGGELPAGLSEFDDYYVQVIDQDTFQLSLEVDGEPVLITTSGSGQHRLCSGLDFSVASAWSVNTSNQQNYTITSSQAAGLTTRLQVLPPDRNWASIYPNYILHHRGARADRIYRVYAWGYFTFDFANPVGAEYHSLSRDPTEQSAYRDGQDAPVFLYEFSCSDPSLKPIDLIKPTLGGRSAAPVSYASEDIENNTQADFAADLDYLYVDPDDTGAFSGKYTQVVVGNETRVYFESTNHGLSELDRIRLIGDQTDGNLVGPSMHSPAYDVFIAKDVTAAGFFLAQEQKNDDLIYVDTDELNSHKLLLTLNNDYEFHRVAAVEPANGDFLELGTSPELIDHAALAQFASDNPDPLFLANFVHNEIELINAVHYREEYSSPIAYEGGVEINSIDEGGLRRNAYSTFIERQGSPKEQCALLISLLRNAGVPATYVFPQRDTLKLKSHDLARILGISFEEIQGHADYIGVNYPWVMAWIEDENRWVHLFPWLKNDDFREGFDIYSVMSTDVANTSAFMEEYLSADPPLMALGNYSDQVEDIWPRFIESELNAHAGLSLDDVGLHSRKRPLFRNSWDDFPVPEIQFSHSQTFWTGYSYPTFGDHPEVVARLIDRIHYHEGEVYEFDLAEVIFKQFGLDGTPTGEEIRTGVLPVCDLTGRNLFWFWNEEDQSQGINASLQVGLSGAHTNDLSGKLSAFPAATNGSKFDSLLPAQRTDIEKPVLASKVVQDSSLSWGVAVEYEENLYFTVDFHNAPENTLWDSFRDQNPASGVLGPRSVRYGTSGTIGVFGGKVSAHAIKVSQDRRDYYQGIVNSSPNPELTDEFRFLYGAVTYLQGINYSKSVSDFTDVLQSAFKVKHISSSHVLLAYLQRTQNGDRPVFDVFNMTNSYTMGGQATPGRGLVVSQETYRDAGLLTVLQSSAAEHGVLESFYGVDAVSTVKILQKAATESYYLNNYGGYVELNSFNLPSESRLNFYDFYDEADRTLQNYYEGFEAWSEDVESLLKDNAVDKDYSFILSSPGHVYALSPDSAFPTPVLDPEEGRPFFAYLTVNWLSGSFGALIGQDHLNGILSHGGYGDSVTDLESTFDEIFNWDTDNPESTEEAKTEFNNERGEQPSDNSEPFDVQIGPNHVDNDTHVADPVNVITGDFYIDETDLVLPGPFSLPIRRNYSSQNLYPGKFGWGWKMGLEDHLDIFPDESIIRAAEMDGTVINYIRVSTNRWEVDDAANSLLSNNRSAGIGGLKNKFHAYIVRVIEGASTVFYLHGADGSIRRFVSRVFNMSGGFTGGLPVRDTAVLDYWEDNSGNRLTFSYRSDPSEDHRRDFGLLHQITSSNGNYLEFEYTAGRQIRTIHTNDGRYVRYEYDEFGDLRKVILPDGSWEAYEYELTDKAYTNPLITVEPYSTHLMTRIVKPEGRILENDYDSQRRVIEQRATVGDDMVPVRNATYVYSGDTSSGWTRVYDVFAEPSQTPATDTNCTLYEYSDGLITRIVDEIGQEIEKAYYATAGTYPDPSGTFNETTKTLPLITTAHGPSDPGDYRRSLMRTEDKRGLVTYFWYDDSGNVVLKKLFGDLDGDPATIEEAAYSFEYNSLNLLTKSVDPANIEKRIYYEDLDYPYLPTRVEHYAQGTLVSTNTSVYGEEEDLVSGEFANGLLKRDSKAVNSSDAAHTEWQHDTRGYVTERRQYVNTGTTTPVANATLDPTSTFIRNDRGEIVTEKVLNAAGGTSIERHFQYDNRSRPIIQTVRDSSGTTLSTQRFYYNQNGELYWTDGPRTGIQDYVFRDYDGAGRIVSESTWRSEAIPDGSGIRAVAGQDGFEGQAIRTFDYDGFGNLERAYDPRGNYVEHDYDEIGQLTETRSYAADGTLLSTETFDQEPGGQLAYYQNPLTGITRKYYTDTGLLRLEERPDGSTSEWRYNTDGRVAREYLRNGYYWQYTYDDPNRTITKQFHEPGGTPYLDADSRTHIEITQFDRRGNAVSTTSRVGLVTTTTFDGLNRPIATSGSGGAVAPYTDEQSGSYSYSRDGLTVTQTNALSETTTTVADALGRPLTVSVRDSSSNLVRLSSYDYAADHNSVQITEGDPAATGQSLVRRTEFTNTFGQSVLVWKHTDEANFDYEISSFDKAGNLVASEDALRQTTRYSYDGLNRLEKSILPDGAVTEHVYDDASNLTQRIMPGGLTEERQFDAAGRIEWTKLTKGAATTRHSTFTYKPIGDPNVGLPAGEADQIRGDSKSFDSYDPLLRLTGMTATGVTPVGEPTVYGYSKSYAYDPSGLVESSTLSYSDPELAASSIEVKNLYDGYGQLYEEETLIDAVTHNTFNQHWDAAGRREQLDTNLTPLSSYQFDWYADGHLKQVKAVETSPVRETDFDFTYDRSGLLASRSNAWRTTTINSRDQRGRELSRSVTAASVAGITTVMDETLAWRADSKLANYTVDRSGSGAWDESRDYIYNARGQLVSESYAPAASEEAKVSYSFDEDKLGVLTRADTYGDAASTWAIPDGQLDGFARMLQEATYGTKVIPAHGLAEGARFVEVALYDGAVKRPLDASFSGAANDWKWEVDLELGAGEYELGVKASHPSGAYTSEEVRSAFTVTGTADQLIDITYDEAGYTQTRTFGDGRIETFFWDCAGRLLRIESRDSVDDGYNFECIYDAYGRRLKTIHRPVLADVAQTTGIVTETCYFDPQVEFLSLMVAINGDRQWKVHGPDLNGRYGSLQGIGGVEAVYEEIVTQWNAAVSDRFGNVLASIEESGADDVLTWSDTRVGGYGAMTGGQLKYLGVSDTASESTTLVETLSWRSHRLDITGYICMGDRYYDPVSGRFLSPDPYGHGASMDLYSFAGGDPVNFVDPTGRKYKPGDPTGKEPWHVVEGSPFDANGNLITDFPLQLNRQGDSSFNVANYLNGQLNSVAQNPFTVAGMQILAGFTPGVGEGMDAYDLAYSDSAFSKSVAGLSLAANAWTLGAAPNLGGIRRGISNGLDAITSLVKTPSSSTSSRLIEFIGDSTRNTQLALPSPTTSNPYPSGINLNAGPAPSGMVIEMAMSPGQPINRPGAFGTLDNITDISYVRNDLAVTPEFKPEVGFVQRYEVAPGTQIQWGPVGPQTHNGVTYPGGGNQVQILVPRAERSQVLKPIGEPRGIQ